jgi:hypothetical protein
VNPSSTIHFYFEGAEASGGKAPLIVKADPRFPGMFAITYTASKIRRVKAVGITIEYILYV